MSSHGLPTENPTDAPTSSGASRRVPVLSFADGVALVAFLSSPEGATLRSVLGIDIPEPTQTWQDATGRGSAPTSAGSGVPRACGTCPGCLSQMSLEDLEKKMTEIDADISRFRSEEEDQQSIDELLSDRADLQTAAEKLRMCHERSIAGVRRDVSGMSLDRLEAELREIDRDALRFGSDRQSVELLMMGRAVVEEAAASLRSQGHEQAEKTDPPVEMEQEEDPLKAAEGGAAPAS